MASSNKTVSIVENTKSWYKTKKFDAKLGLAKAKLGLNFMKRHFGWTSLNSREKLWAKNVLFFFCDRLKIHDDLKL